MFQHHGKAIRLRFLLTCEKSLKELSGMEDDGTRYCEILSNSSSGVSSRVMRGPDAGGVQVIAVLGGSRRGSRKSFPRKAGASLF